MAGSALPVTDLGEGSESCWAFCGPEAAGLRKAAAGLVWVQAGLLQRVTASTAPENPTLILSSSPTFSSFPSPAAGVCGASRPLLHTNYW